MTASRLLGLAIAAVGMFFLAVGIDATHAAWEQLSHDFMGQLTHETMLYVASGIAAIIAGGVLVIAQPQ